MVNYDELHSAITELSHGYSPCNVCGGTFFDVGAEAFTMPRPDGQGGHDMIVLTCQRCANVRLFSLYKLLQLIEDAKREHAQGNGQA